MDKYLELLKQFVSFRTVSTDSNFKSDIHKCVEWLNDLFTSNGFEFESVEGYGNPIIITKKIVDPSLKTILIYGHYDVQPAEKTDGWTSEPYTLRNDNKRLYARGVVDNKGEVLVHMTTVFELLKENSLKYNIKFIIEGDEETGSPDVLRFMNDNKEKLACDLIIISDGEITKDNPILEASLRGIVNFEINIKTASNDLHSGLFGGAAPNAIHEISKIISKFTNDDNSIAIEGFYDGIEIENNVETAPFDLEEYKRITGAKATIIPANSDFRTATGQQPALSVTGIAGGYYGEGVKTIIPHKATAKVNIRTVEGQDEKKLIENIKSFLKNNIPDYVDYEVKFEEPYPAVKLDLTNEYIQQAKDLLEEVYGQKAYFSFVGGTIPIVRYFKDLLNVPILSIPLCNEDCNMHGVDENFEIDKLEKALEFSKKLLSK